MKILTKSLFVVFFLCSFVSTAFAAEIIKEQGGNSCIDLKAAYQTSRDTSAAVTGELNSLDTVKKADTLASLINILSILLGDSVFCVNDESVVMDTSVLKTQGLLGMVETGNQQVLSLFPTVNIVEHLAEEFVPGYGMKNSTLAQGGGQCVRSDWTECYCGNQGPDCKPVSDTWPPEEPVSPPVAGQCVTSDWTVCYCGSQNPDCKPVSDTWPPEESEPPLVGGNEKTRSMYNQMSANQRRVVRVVNEKLGNNMSVEEIFEGQEKAIEEENNAESPESLGYNYLKNTLRLDLVWAETRNIAYLFFVVAMIVIGFMIMFRNKLGGQVMVTVGNSIPKLIICLLLVTFSFSISGLVLDLGKMGMNVVTNTFVRIQERAGVQNVAPVNISGVEKLSDQAIFSLLPIDYYVEKSYEVPIIGQFLGDSLSSLSTAWGKAGGAGTTALMSGGALYTGLLSFLSQVVMDSNPLAGISGLGFSAGNVPSAVLNFFLGFAKYGLTTLLIVLILYLLIALYASVKLFITMITTYVKIMISVVLGPIQIAMGAIPGNFNSVTRWFKTLVGHVLVFVVIVAVIGFAQFLGEFVDPTKFNFFGNKGIFWPSGMIAVKGVFTVGGYLFASNAPTMVNGFMKIEEDKTMSSLGTSVKQSASKIPVIGGIFNK